MVILFLELTLWIWKDNSSASFLSDQAVANEKMMATTMVLLLLVSTGKHRQIFLSTGLNLMLGWTSVTTPVVILLAMALA